METQPKTVAVIGGGYIGVELAGVFQALGSETTLFTRADKPLKNFDAMIVDGLLAEMKKQNLNFVPNSEPNAVRKNADGTLTLVTTSGECGPFDQVLFATGRVPSLDGLNLQAADVKLNERGYVVVDAFQQTSAKGCTR